MSPLSDALQNPSKALADLYLENKHKGIDAFPATVTSHFSSLFASENDFQQIPVLDLNHSPDSFAERSLVVFHAMVQDTSLSPELYLATQGTDGYGGWGSNLLDQYESNSGGVHYENLRECTTFWAVSIPSITPWCYAESLNKLPPQQSSMQNHKFPLPNAPHIGVQLKIYDEKLAKPIRTTDIMSFVGILGTEPLHANNDLRSPIHVPTLHALFCVPLTRTIVPRSFPDASILPTIKNLRQELIQWIASEALAGDVVTAEWVLISTLSHVRSRHPPILPLSLTISGFPAPPIDNIKAEPALYHVLSQIFPLVTLLPLSLETLNNTSFCPESKDEDLHSGWLQQPKGTIMMITEGAITEGGIFNKGLTNIRATQKMMKEQELEYIFPFSGLCFETDVRFLITTEGKRSTFFKTDATVPLRTVLPIADHTTSIYKPASDISLPPAQILIQFRQLVGGASIGNVTVGDALGKYVEEDFVRERSTQDSRGLAEGQPTFGPDDLIQRMLVARLIAMSLHQNEVTIAEWEAAKELERNAKART